MGIGTEYERNKKCVFVKNIERVILLINDPIKLNALLAMVENVHNTFCELVEIMIFIPIYFIKYYKSVINIQFVYYVCYVMRYVCMYIFHKWRKPEFN